jgi:pimeloyl-ACP methyl ester carboxylesterase
MIIEIKEINNVDLYSIKVQPPYKSNVIIVGNAYGIMPYVQPLAEELAKNGFAPFWFPFSGQEGKSGYYSFEQGTKDLGNVITAIREQNNLPIHILAHCAGSLIILEYLLKNPQANIDKFIVYGLLYNMNKRRPIAERKLINTGVSFNLSEQDWQYNPSDAIREVNKEILFCHPKDKLNLERATIDEMNSVIALKNGNELKWFEEGYDSNINKIADFIDTYISYLDK